MQIETYECEELKSSEATTMAVDAEAIELIEKLGLKGQKSLTNKETLTRDPYREMTKLELYVWRSMCPETTKLDEYRLSPLPLRILQVAAYANELSIYDYLEVWHPRQVKDDPILVGVPKGEKYGHKRHMLARWGETLMSFSDATARAKEKYAMQFKAQLNKLEREIELVKHNLSGRIDEGFLEESFDLPSWYGLEK
jgi:hypothetical protein